MLLLPKRRLLLPTDYENPLLCGALAVNNLIGFGAGQSTTPYSIQGGPATTTDTGAYTLVDRTLSVANSVTITTLGMFMNTAAKSVTLKIVKENSSTNFDIVASQVFSHGATGWEDFTLSSPYAVPASGTYRLAAYWASGTANVYSVSRAYQAGDASGSGQVFTGDTQSTPVLRAAGYS